jgi:hypothetical protein
MAYRFIKLNKAKCLTCGDVLISKPETPAKEVSCNCGGLTIAGGATHTVRRGTNYKDMCVLDFSSCPDVSTSIPDVPPPGSSITEDELEAIRKKYNS